MAYVKRDQKGVIVAISREADNTFTEQIADNSAELQAFLSHVGHESELAETDFEFIRVLDDLLSVLLEKNVLMFTELPQEAQAKFLERNRLRKMRGGALNLLDDEKLL